jgi:hypothetical protein
MLSPSSGVCFSNMLVSTCKCTCYNLEDQCQYFHDHEDLRYLVVYSVGQGIFCLYGTKIFVTNFTKACFWTLSWTSQTESTISNPLHWRSIITLFSHLCLHSCIAFGRTLVQVSAQKLVILTKVFVAFSVPAGKCWDITLNYTTTSSCHIFSIHHSLITV